MRRPLRRIGADEAWAPYEPTAERPWDLARVAHLHRRAGFAPSWNVLQRDLKDGPDAALARLLKGEAKGPDGRDATEFANSQDALDQYAATSGNLTRLQAAWLYRLIFTPHPLRERMTLFWHNHFATSHAKVNSTRLMCDQVAMLRSNALGRFPEMLKAVARDPAMLLWLDAAVNRKAHPNENYAREVMELFTLGRGHYSEKDIQEAARAFTGTYVQADRYKELLSQHDSGEKTVLGRAGRLKADDIADILLAQPACAMFLCRKLVKHFVNEVDEPSDELIEPLAETLRQSSYDIRGPVETILRSRLFFDEASLRRRVKSPVELAVGAVRSLEILEPTISVDALADACRDMGQALYAPPSVAGWDWGAAWINTSSTVVRTNFLLALVSADDEKFGGRFDPRALAGRHGRHSNDEVMAFFLELFVEGSLPDEVRQRVSEALDGESPGSEAAPRQAVGLILTAPEYQLA